MMSAGQGIPPVKKTRAGERSLTIMVMGKVGKVRSFHLSRRLLFWTLFFFAAYIPLSAYLANRYFDLSRENKTQQRRIELLERELSRSANALSRSNEHILFLEEYVLQAELPEGRAPQPPRPQARKAEDTAGSRADSKGEDTPQGTVSVEDLVLEKRGGMLEVGFRVVNLTPDDTTVGGYVHLAAKGEEGQTRLDWTYPQVRRVDGFPENFRRGQMFLIQRFKPMEGWLPIGSDPDAPTEIEILVYDQAGGILLQKEYPIP